MPRFTVTVPDDLNDWLDEQSDEGGRFDSKSGAARHHLEVAKRVAEADADVEDLLEAVDRVADLEDEVAELEDRLDSREERIDELEEQLARRSQIEDRVDELAIEVREQQETAQAPFFVKWYRWFQERGEDDT